MTIELKPSPRQEALIEFARKGRGNGAVKAQPGSGKTTSLMMMANELVGFGKIAFLAFSGSIVAVLKQRAPKGVHVSTINSLAFGGMKRKYPRSEMDDNKYYKIAKDLIQDCLDGCGPIQVSDVQREALENIRVFSAAGDLRRLADKVRVTLTDEHDEDAVYDCISHFELDLDYKLVGLYIEMLPYLLKEGRRLAHTYWDFVDQLWLTATEDDIRIRRFDILLVDEAQDMSKVQLAVVMKALTRGGRAIFVGDPNQAIFGFAGADCESFDRIVDEMNCTVLPLDVCYRCPTSHIALLQEIVPDIKAAPGAIEGIIKHIKVDALEPMLNTGDLVLCRRNAPLLTLCFRLIAEGVPARIKGRNIGERLVGIVKKVSKMRGFAWSRFNGMLRQWQSAQVAQILDANEGNLEDPAIENLADRVRCVSVVWNSGECESLRDFEDTIADLFDDRRSPVWLSSVHRAKGLEAHTVFLLEPEKLGVWGSPGSWQHKQERHLEFVAKSRSKDTMVFIQTPSDGPSEDELQEAV